MIKFLNAMEPYGPGNMRPIFVSNNLSIDGIPKLLGQDQSTLKFYVKQNKTLIESIGFNMELSKLNTTLQGKYTLYQVTFGI